MKSFEKYIIVSDMDGTFLGTGATILPNNIEAIRNFQENGGVFTLATGRDTPVMEFIFPNAVDYLSCPAILCNGSYLYDFKRKEFLFEQTIDQSDAIELISEFREQFPHIGYRITTAKGFLTDHCTDFLLQNLKKFLPILTVGNLNDHRDIPWHKIVYCADEDVISPLFDYISKKGLEQFDFTRSTARLVEIVPKGVSKGNSLKHLRKLYPDRKIICVGDYTNDLDMLEKADIAASPENALDSVKAISSIHLCHHNEGCIADLIHQLAFSYND